MADSIVGADPPARVRVAASERYGTERVYRYTLGGGYRELWQAEIDLPVLDLAARGLTPTGRFGGLQTAVLGLRAKDGRLFTFRGTDKDPSAVLDPELHGTVFQAMVQQQMAAQHPGGALVTSVISEAAGVLTIHETGVVMPDDPVLGEYREEFAGMVGTFFEFPTAATDTHAGFHGATEIIDYEALYDRLEEGQDDLVDTKAFLRARLLDLLLGDFDRHRKQWRWARLPGSSAWQPIPEDRDMVFVRYEGLVKSVGSLYVPILQRYGPEYPSMKGLTLHGWEQDRWLLPHLSWPEWESIAADMQARITDEVIERALATLPPEYLELDGARLREDLSGRRDRLLEGARRFYEHLAGAVNVEGSDAAERVSVVRASDGTTRVELWRDGDREAHAPVFARTFESADTDEVRIYLRAGQDRVSVSGGEGPIRVRVIAGEDRTIVDDRQGGGTRVYDSAGVVELSPGPGTKIDTRAYEPPAPDAGFVDVEDVPARDWGSDFVPLPMFGYEKDVGVFLGLQGIYTRYGFRRHPWSSRQSLSAGYATEAKKARVRYFGAMRPENSQLLFELEAFFSGIEVLRFYGFGNDTDNDASDKFYRVRNEQVRFAPGVSTSFVDDTIQLSTGPWLQHSSTKDGDRLINIADPYGSGKFGAIGAFASVRFDTRRTPAGFQELALPLHRNPAAGYPMRGLLVDVLGLVSPPVWDVEETWGSIEASIAGFWTFEEFERLTFGARLGGKQTFGLTPYWAAAYIGGGDTMSGSATVRGFRAQRFGGEASFFSNLDLRLFLIRLKLIVPGDLGVLVFGDVGRVFVDDPDDSGKWHPSWGGGIWFAPLSRVNAVSLSVAGSQEDTLVYLRLGFQF